MTIITLDIETLPSFDPAIKEQIRTNIKPPAQHKKPESIMEWLLENGDRVAEEEYRKTSFDGALGHVCVIGCAVGDEEPWSFCIENQEDETRMLRDFFTWIDSVCKENRNLKPTFIGHNLVNFDLNFIKKRAIVLGVKPSIYIPFNAKPWDEHIFDTMLQWDIRNSISLDKLCRALGIKGKDGIDGSMVYDMFLAGQIDRLVEYCKHDVEITREVYKRMTFKDQLL